jgi:hypothetical protein
VPRIADYLHPLVLLALGFVAGGPWLAPIVIGSIYLPLWPLGKLGLPVIRLSGSIFALPTAAGWVAIVVSWSLIHWLFAAVIVRLLHARDRGP